MCRQLISSILFLSLFLYALPSQASSPIPLDLSVSPNVELRSFGGKVFHLSDFRGHMIALHFWASWCVPCRVEMPKIKRFLVNNPKAIVIPISMDRNPKNAMRFLDKEGISIPLMFGGSDIADSFRIRAIPTTIILDKDRRFLYKIQGQAPWNTKDFRDLMLGFSQRLP